MIKTLPKNFELLVYLNEDDPSLDEYPKGFFVGPDQPTVKSWNFLAEKASGDFLMVGADDILFKRWKPLIAPKDGIACYSFYDGRAENSHPHPCVTRKWYETLGYVGYPAFKHWYIDTWNVTIAKKINRFCYDKESWVDHLHAKDGKAENDDTYQRIRRDGTHAHDVQTWHSLQKTLEQEAKKLESLCDRDCGLPWEPSW